MFEHSEKNRGKPKTRALEVERKNVDGAAREMIPCRRRLKKQAARRGLTRGRRDSLSRGETKKGRTHKSKRNGQRKKVLGRQMKNNASLRPRRNNLHRQEGDSEMCNTASKKEKRKSRDHEKNKKKVGIRGGWGGKSGGLVALGPPKGNLSVRGWGSAKKTNNERKKTAQKTPAEAKVTPTKVE